MPLGRRAPPAARKRRAAVGSRLEDDTAALGGSGASVRRRPAGGARSPGAPSPSRPRDRAAAVPLHLGFDGGSPSRGRMMCRCGAARCALPSRANDSTEGRRVGRMACDRVSDLALAHPRAPRAIGAGASLSGRTPGRATPCERRRRFRGRRDDPCRFFGAARCPRGPEGPDSRARRRGRGREREGGREGERGGGGRGGEGEGDCEGERGRGRERAGEGEKGGGR